MVTFNRWTSADENDCLEHGVDPSAGFNIDGIYYAFRSSVLHMGSTRNSGHYVAVAKHRAPEESFWLYDDGKRVYATDDEVQARGQYRFRTRGMGPLKSYLAFFERE